MLKKIKSLLEKHDAFFIIFIFLVFIGSMYIYYRIDPVYENEIVLENREFDLINGDKLIVEDYLYLFNDRKFKEKIMSISYLPDNFNFEDQINITKNEEKIKITLTGSDDLKSRLVLSAITKNFKDIIKKDLSLKNENLLISLKNDRNETEKKYKETLEQKEKYLKDSNYKTLKLRFSRLKETLNHNINYTNTLREELKRNEKKLSKSNFNRNNYLNYKKEQQAILMSQYFYEKALQNTENKIDRDKSKLKILEKELLGLNKELETYNKKTEEFSISLKNNEKLINQFEKNLQEKNYKIKTLNFYDTRMIDNRPLKALGVVVLLSLLFAFPFWKLKL